MVFNSISIDLKGILIRFQSVLKRILMGLGVQGLGFRVQGLGVQGLGFKVEGLRLCLVLLEAQIRLKGFQ